MINRLSGKIANTDYRSRLIGNRDRDRVVLIVVRSQMPMVSANLCFPPDKLLRPTKKMHHSKPEPYLDVSATNFNLF